jgi:exosortase family protein XrtF
MTNLSVREFRPTLLFLGKFLGLYLVGSLLYGLYVNSYKPEADPVTHWVTVQSAAVLSAIGHESIAFDIPRTRTTAIIYKERSVVSVYEGCNGLNVAIIFLSFVIAFGPYTKRMAWFIPAGLLIIHIFNLFRIIGLFLIVRYAPGYLYFTHKFLFTAFIYAIVFALWLWWVGDVFKKKKHAVDQV